MDTKACIMDVLNAQAKAVSLKELLEGMRESGQTDAAQTKVALWALIAQAEVELTPDRLLRAAVRTA